MPRYQVCISFKIFDIMCSVKFDMKVKHTKDLAARGGHSVGPGRFGPVQSRAEPSAVKP